MKQHIKVSVDSQSSFRNSKVTGMFDLPEEKKICQEWDVCLPIDDKKWNIGCIIGTSGSGKSTIARKMFPDHYHNGFEWSDQSILDGFDSSLDTKDIVNMLSHVGFSSPPSWLCPYHVLSNGQKFRVDMARSLLEDKTLTVIDEFTSVVDRNVAKIGSVAISKTIKKFDKKFIAVSCHDDILEWLEPDWVYNVNENNFKWVFLRRPQIKVSIYQANKEQKSKIWDLFKKHHYLSRKLSPSAKCFFAVINNNICAFTSYITMPFSQGGFMYRAHRTVVLPDYQGVGIGNKMSEFLGYYIKDKFGKSLYATTSHPAMIFYRNKSLKWRTISKPEIKKRQNFGSLSTSGSHNRLTASFEFKG